MPAESGAAAAIGGAEGEEIGVGRIVVASLVGTAIEFYE
jgi:hypothetical protein